MEFVVFSDDWGAHPSSCQQVFRHVARHHQVLWINTVGLRAPRLSMDDLRKGLRKAGSMMGRQRPASAAWTEQPALLSIAQPAMLPLPNSALARRFNAHSVIRAVRNGMAQLDMRNPVIVTTVPNVDQVLRCIRARAAIYYCVDDFKQWPGLAHDAVTEMENRLLEEVDLILASSALLYDRLSALHEHVEIFPHGVDPDLYRSPLPSPPRWLSALPGPRIGFYGLLDERLDERLISVLARQRPDWQFVLAGPQVVTLPLIEGLSNVHRPGNIPYGQLPSLVHGFDALIIPYRVDSFTHTLAPLKLNEYVLSGLPVVSSALNGASGNPLVRVVHSQEGWLQALAEGMGADREARRELAATMLGDLHWENRAHSLIRRAGQIKASRVPD